MFVKLLLPTEVQILTFFVIFGHKYLRNGGHHSHGSHGVQHRMCVMLLRYDLNSAAVSAKRTRTFSNKKYARHKGQFNDAALLFYRCADYTAASISGLADFKFELFRGTSM